MSTVVYRTSLTKHRRTRAQMAAIRDALRRICAEDRPVTCRQVFYRLVAEGWIAKTEGEYRATVCRLLAEMRRDGDIPYGWLSDNTRWMRKPITYSSLESALRRTVECYRRQLWDNQEVYVELWLEKDALAGVLYEITEQFDVPLMVTRGYPSLTFLYEAAEALTRQHKPVFIYYFGDHDPSGINIAQTVERELRRFAPAAEIHFEVVAVTPEQIARWNLPTRPTKPTDSRSKAFTGRSVEVDAIPPAMLRRLATDCIRRHIDGDRLAILLAIEEQERQILRRFAATRWEAMGDGVIWGDMG